MKNKYLLIKTLISFKWASLFILTLSSLLFSQTNWTLHTRPLTGGLLHDGHWNGEQFVVVGEKGRALQSLDGIEWSETNIDDAHDYYALDWSGQLYIATGSSIMISENGITWEVVEAPIPGPYNSILWDGTKFIITTATRAILFTENGKEWTVIENETVPFDVFEIAYNGKMYVAALGLNKYAYSTDAETWNEGSLHWDKWRDYYHLAVMSVDSAFYLFQSSGLIYYATNPTDSASWQKVHYEGSTRIQAYAQKGNRFYFGGGGGVSYHRLTDSTHFEGIRTSWYDEEDRITTTFIVQGDGVTIAGGAGAPYQEYHFAYNDNGYAWDDLSKVNNNDNLTNTEFVSVYWIDNQYIATGRIHTHDLKDSIGIIATSPDGKTWDIQTIDQSAKIYNLVKANNKLIAYGKNGKVFISNDGHEWDLHEINLNVAEQRIVTDGTRLIGILDSIILTSMDGIQWDTVAQLETPEKQRPRYSSIDGIVYFDGMWIANRRQNIYSSKNGLDWSLSHTFEVDEDNSSHFNVFKVCGSKVVIGFTSRSANGLYYSEDGIHWEKSAHLPYEPDLIACNDTTIIAGEKLWSNLYTTSDFNEWKIAHTGTSYSFSHLLWGNNEYLALGDNDLIATSPSDFSLSESSNASTIGRSSSEDLVSPRSSSDNTSIPISSCLNCSEQVSSLSLSSETIDREISDITIHADFIDVAIYADKVIGNIGYDMADEYGVIIYDFTGKVITNRFFTTPQFSLSLSNVDQGGYILVVLINNKKTSTVPFVR